MASRSRASALLLPLLAHLGSSALVAQTPRWSVVEELRIGRVDGEAPYVFGQLRGVIPDAMGRIWALESQAKELRLFDVQGRFVRSVGRSGEGPGEFGGALPPCAYPGPNGELWVEDGRRRWQSFDSAGARLTSRPTVSNVGCGMRRWTPDGRWVVVNVARNPATGRTSSSYTEYRLGSDGALVAGRTFATPDTPPDPTVRWVRPGQVGGNVLVLPFWHQSTALLGPTGDFWVTEGGGTYNIRRQTLAGDIVYRIQRPHTPVPIPTTVRDQAIREFGGEGMVAEGGFDPDDVPRNYPPFDSFFMGRDGTLFVRRNVASGKQVLDVFSPEGRYLAEAAVPDNFGDITIQHVVGDKMYGIYRDALGVPYAVRLGIRGSGD